MSSIVKGADTMLVVSDKASEEIQKVLEGTQAKGNNLIIYFQGMGWGGPALGMALEESIDGLEKIEANGVSAYIDPNLKAFLGQFGSINVDYIQREVGNSGFTIRVGSGESGCSSCESASEGCS